MSSTTFTLLGHFRLVQDASLSPSFFSSSASSLLCRMMGTRLVCTNPCPPVLDHLGKSRKTIMITSYYLNLLHINTNLSKKGFPGGSPSSAANSDGGYAPLLGEKIARNWSFAKPRRLVPIIPSCILVNVSSQRFFLYYQPHSQTFSHLVTNIMDGWYQKSDCEELGLLLISMICPAVFHGPPHSSWPARP